MKHGSEFIALKTKASIMTIAAFTLVFPCGLLSQKIPDSTQVAEWSEFNESYGNNWIIRWNEQTGTPGFIYGHYTEPYSGTPEQIAIIFLTENRTLFNMKDNLQDLELKRIRENQGVTHIKFGQNYEGIPVYSAEYYVHMGSDNRIQMVNGRYFPNIQADTIPGITDIEAINYAMTHVIIQGGLTGTPEAELVVYPFEESFLTVWKVIIPNIPNAKWRCFVDANNGQVIRYEDILMHTQGEAKVYLRDPVNSNLTDETIYNLNPPGYELDGTYIKCENSIDEEGNAYSEQRNFRYLPPPYTEYDPTHFDEANVYYHVDKFADEYLPTTGFEGIGQRITAHVKSGVDFAYGGLSGLSFGLGAIKFWDMSKKDDIIYHEYMHAVSEYLGLEYYEQSAVMNEGYSDYFAASYTNVHLYGKWVTKLSCCDHLRTLQSDPNSFNYQNYSSPPEYNNDYNSTLYRRSMIWSGTLWDLREAVSQDVADKLIMHGLDYVTGFATFEGGRYGVLQADIDLYNGEYETVINNVFDARGIYFVAPLAPSGFDVSGNVGENPQLSWNANTEPDLAGYKIYRSINLGPFNLIVTLNESQLSYTDYGVVIGGGKFDPRACWYVTAYDVAYQESAPSTGECEKVRIYKASVSSEIPRMFTLHANYPNPFNPITMIKYDLPEYSFVEFTIYDLTGREIRTLINGNKTSGFKRVVWDGKDNSGNAVSSGMYIYRLEAISLEDDRSFTQTRKMVLLR